MTDESQPDGVEDPRPDQDEQALAGNEGPSYSIALLFGLIGVVVLAFGVVDLYEAGELASLNPILVAVGLALLSVSILRAIQQHRAFKRGAGHSGKMELVTGYFLGGLFCLLLLAKLVKVIIGII